MASGNSAASPVGNPTDGVKVARLQSARVYKPYNGKWQFSSEGVGTIPSTSGKPVVVFEHRQEPRIKVEILKTDIENSTRPLSNLIRDRAKEQKDEKTRHLGQRAMQNASAISTQLRKMADTVDSGIVSPLAQQDIELGGTNAAPAAARAAAPALVSMADDDSELPRMAAELEEGAGGSQGDAADGVRVVPVVYAQGRNPSPPAPTDTFVRGDFEKMIVDPKHANALFVFNENMEDAAKSTNGGGTAMIRQYVQRPPTNGGRAIGMPTGYWPGKKGGFTTLGAFERACVVWGAQSINRVLHDNPQIEFVYYACESVKKLDTLGTETFTVDPGALGFIMSKLQSIPQLLAKAPWSQAQLDAMRDRLIQRAKAKKDEVEDDDGGDMGAGGEMRVPAEEDMGAGNQGVADSGSMGSNSFEEGDEEEDEQGEVESFRETERERLRKQLPHLDDDDVAQEVERRVQRLMDVRKKQGVSEKVEGSRSSHNMGSASQSLPRATKGSTGEGKDDAKPCSPAAKRSRDAAMEATEQEEEDSTVSRKRRKTWKVRGAGGTWKIMRKCSKYVYLGKDAIKAAPGACWVSGKKGSRVGYCRKVKRSRKSLSGNRMRRMC